MKRLFAVLLVGVMISISSMAYADDSRSIGKGIKLGGILKTLTIKTMAIEDPDNPFITVYMTQVVAGGISLADPSNSSVAARLTGSIPVDAVTGKQKIVTKTDLEIFKASKSVMTKNLRIARFYDPVKNTLVYITYSKKLIDGSAKHSLSVVHLGEKK